MFSLKRNLKRIIGRAVPGLLERRPPPFRPDLSDRAMFDRLGPGFGLLDGAQARFAAGDTAGAKRIVVSHFRRRRTPAFFVDADRIRDLIATVERDHPDWRAAALDRASANLREGLPAFAVRGGPLDARFSFSALVPGPGGDALYVKKAHRFGFLPRLALTALYGAPSRDALHSVIKTWIDEVGAHGDHNAYSSNLVVGYRILAMTWAVTYLQAAAILPDDTDSEIEFDILKILSADAEFFAPRIGDSVPNNHLLADGFIGWFLGLMYPEFPCTSGLAGKGEAIWLEQLRRQILDDGTVFEHSTHYHELDSEMAVAYVLLGRRNGLGMPSWVSDRIERMLAFQAAISGPEAIPQCIGDSVEEPLWPLDDGTGWAAGCLRELYRALFRAEAAPTPRSDPSVERAFWLTGGALAPAEPQPAAPASLAPFPDGGFYVFTETDPETRLTFRTGPRPEAPMAVGHMHADLLSINLTVAGTPVIVDPGTYTYRGPARGWPAGEPAWRRHFMGPESHNGLAIAGHDPLGPIAGDFRQGDPPVRVETTRTHSGAGLALVEAEAVGPSPYAGHRRGVIHVAGQYWLVYDVLPAGLDRGQASLGLQFAPGASVTATPGVIRADLASRQLFLAHAESLVLADVAAGRRRPPAGWVSPSYGQIVSAPNVRFGFADDNPRTCFVLCIEPALAAEIRVDPVPMPEPSFAFRVKSAACDDLLIVNSHLTDKTLTTGGVSFRGALAWVRSARGVPSAVRWIDGLALTWPDRNLEVAADQPVPSLDVRLGADGPVVAVGPKAGLRLRWG